MTLTPSVRAISLCGVPCLAKSFACASFVATSTRECRFSLAISACPQPPAASPSQSSCPECIFWTNAALRVNDYAEAKKAKNRQASGHKKESRSMTLTPEQARDLAQMSPAMWDMLRSVKLYRGGYSRSPGTAEMLARSGFIEMTKPRPDADGFYSARLTEAGVEALAPSWRRRGMTTRLGRPVACRAAYRFLSFELLDEGGEMRGDGCREGVVLILEALPNC
jgi:hypothetical protein